MSIDRINNKAIHDGTDYTMHSLHAVDSVLTTEIKHPNGATGLTIDENGYMLTPNRPAFQTQVKHLTTPAQGSYSISGTAAVFNKGNHYDQTTGNFIAPADGVYQFIGHSKTANYGQHHPDSFLIFSKNGTAYTSMLYTQGHMPTSSYYHSWISIAYITLAANDNVTLTYHNHHNPSSISYYLQFQGHLIG